MTLATFLLATHHNTTMVGDDMTAPATSYLNDADTIEAAVYQALGAASMCWDTLRGAGVFRSEEAKVIADELIARIRAERTLGR